ncbi:sigma-70 family RNA polymerase sigma factor [Actinosynnema sp. NPDC050436]|uniref:sigma-70 family RNA polymerase sigma factor n=1 Tax=Actinosynnema sp. NPDC050436 TaxID=3155659 RepID=UPI0034060E1A
MNSDLRARVGRLQPFIHATVRRYCHLPLPAHLSHDDLVQDASLSVLTALPRYADTPESMQGWVAVIVRRRVAEVYRAAKTWRHHPVEDMTGLIHRLDRHHRDAGHTAGDGVTAAELLSHLDERSRRILLLHGVHDLPHDEIARLVDSTTAAVRVAYSRALVRLRAMSQWGIGMPVTLLHRDMVRPHPRNLDRDLGDLGGLAASIEAHGLRRPLLLHRLPGRGRPLELLDGHRHLAATARTRRTQTPVVVLTDVSRTWLARARHGLPPAEARSLLVEHLTTGRTTGS